MICFFSLWYYQDVVGKITGLKRMKILDAMTFVSNDTACVNVMSVSEYVYKMDLSELVTHISKMIRILPKMRYKVVECAGDYYYEEMPIEEVL